MTVYVDDMEAEFKPPHARGRRYVMCHMISDDPNHAALDAWIDKHHELRRSLRGTAVTAYRRPRTR